MTTYRSMMVPVRTHQDLVAIAKSGAILSERADLTTAEKTKIRNIRKFLMEHDERTLAHALRRKKLGIPYDRKLLGDPPARGRR